MNLDVLTEFDDLAIPNIDAMPTDELAAFDETLRMLAGYTRHAVHARKFRLEGHVSLAQVHESACERMYARLPQAVRW